MSREIRIWTADRPGKLRELGAAVVAAGIDLEDLDVVRDPKDLDGEVLRLRLVVDDATEGLDAVLARLGWATS